MTPKQTAYKYLSNFDLEINFGWYFYEMKEKHPGISRKEIIDLYNDWQELNNDEWGDRYVRPTAQSLFRYRNNNNS